MKPPLYFENPKKPANKLTPQQWDQQNVKLGYNPVPGEKTAYKHYYNPNDYAMDENGGFVKKSDVGNLNINYNNDPTYKPLITYQPPVEDIAPKKQSVIADSGRKAFDFQYLTQGYTGYKYDNGDVKYLNDKGEDLLQQGQQAQLSQQQQQTAKMKSGGLVKKVKGYAGGGISDEDAGSIINGASAIGGAIGQGIQINNTKADGTIDPNKAGLATGLKDASAGAALGAQIGSVIPGVGTLIGGGIGLVGGGLYGALTGNKQARDSNDVIQKQLADKAKVKEDVQRNFNFNNNLSTAFADRQAGYKDGGKIEGSGTAKSDSIKAKIEKGSFIVPAENAEAAEAIRKTVLKAPSMKKANLKQKDGEEVKLSNGEHLFTPEEKEEILANGIDLDALAPNAQNNLRNHLNKGGKVKGYLDGGDSGEDGNGGFDPEALKKLRDRTGGKEKDLAQKKQYQQELLGLKNRADSGDALSKGIYMKRGAELSKYINDINKQYGITDTPDAATTKKITAPKIASAAPNTNIKTQSNSLTNNSPFSKDSAAEENPNITPPPAANGANPQPGVVNKTAGVDPNQASWDRDSAEALSRNPPSSGISDTGSALSKGLGAVLNYGLPLVQAGLGLNYLKKAGARPVDQIDPDYLNGISKSQGIVERANNAAKYGYTPEEQAAIDSQNNNATEAQRFAARDLSGGSAANAYTMERNALNDSYGRGLQAKLGGRQLQLEKQSYADQKQGDLNNLLQDKANRSRMLFGDTMNAFMQNQQAGSNLVGAGLSNLIGANRYQQELSANDKRNKMYNPQYPTTTT